MPSRVSDIYRQLGDVYGRAAEGRRQLLGQAIGNIAQIPQQIQQQRREQQYDDERRALARAREAREAGDYRRAEEEFARAEKMRELKGQIVQAATAGGAWDADIAIQAANSATATAPEIAADVVAWTQDYSAKLRPELTQIETTDETGAKTVQFVRKTEGQTFKSAPKLTLGEPKPYMVGGKRTMLRTGSDNKLYDLQGKVAEPDITPDEPPMTPYQEQSLQQRRDAAAAAAKQRETPTPTAQLDATLKLRDRFTRETQAANTVNTQLALMKSSLKAAEGGNMAAGSQGVLVTFQKILDPTSVVRESEYARSAAGQSLLSRIEGAVVRLAKGGAGVPIQELKQFVTLAEQFAKNQANSAANTKKQIDAIATEYGLKPENITRDLGDVAPAANNVGDVVTVKGVRMRITKIKPDGSFEGVIVK